MIPFLVIVIEQGETSFGASVPDLPGCVAVGKTLEEVRERIAVAIEFHTQRRAFLKSLRPRLVEIAEATAQRTGPIDEAELHAQIEAAREEPEMLEIHERAHGAVAH